MEFKIHPYCRLAHTLRSGAAMSEGNGKCNYIVNLVKLNVMLQFGKGPRTRLIDEQVDGRRKSCWDNITCLTVAVAVGFVLYVIEAIVITLVLAFPGTVGIHGENFFTGQQRALLGIATVVMQLESIVISAIDVCKCMNL